MAVKIGEKVFRNEQEQVQKNMKDIEALKQYIKEAYKCSSELTSSTDQVLKSLTNAGEDVTSGWLMDTIGNLFTITGGDDTYLLLDFFTSLRGPEGEQGEQGVPGTTAIDDSETSLLKTWSSKKISDKLDLISDKGIYYTFVQPILNVDVYELNTSDLENPNQYTFQKYNDIIVYIDSNGKVKEFYNCVSVSGDFSTIYLEKVGEVGGGSQLYQHNIVIKDTNHNVRCCIQIINNSNVSFTSAALYSFLKDNGFKTDNKQYMATGDYSGSNIIRSVVADSSDNIWFNYGSTGYSVAKNALGSFIYDTVIAL